MLTVGHVPISVVGIWFLSGHITIPKRVCGNIVRIIPWRAGDAIPVSIRIDGLNLRCIDFATDLHIGHRIKMWPHAASIVRVGEAVGTPIALLLRQRAGGSRWYRCHRHWWRLRDRRYRRWLWRGWLRSMGRRFWRILGRWILCGGILCRGSCTADPDSIVRLPSELRSDRAKLTQKEVEDSRDVHNGFQQRTS